MSDSTILHLDSLIQKLVDCRKLEHGEMVSDEEMAALIKVRDWLNLPNGIVDED